MGKKSKFILRLMSPKGLYLKKSFLHKDAIFISDIKSKIVFSLVKYNENHINDFYSEMVWAYIPEIRLWSSLLLSVEEQVGSLCIYPNVMPIFIDSSEFPSDEFDSDDFKCSIRDYIYNKANGIDCLLSANYTFRSPEVNSTMQAEFFEKIDPNAQLLMRGLSLLLKSQIISRNHLLMEEAALLVYIALEAGLKIIKNRLIENGNRNPSFKDVLLVIEEKFPYGETLCEYFKDCYENRTIIVHPENIFGTYYVAPLCADDFYDTYTDVINLYRFLVSDSHYT